MILSTTTTSMFKCFGIEKGIEVAAHAGFDAIDLNLNDYFTLMYQPFSDDFSTEKSEKTCQLIKKSIANNGIHVNQTHAPFPSRKFYGPVQAQNFYNTEIHPRIVESIKIAGMLGSKQIIIHPVHLKNDTKEYEKEFNLEFYNSLVPYCKEYNIKIAVENMYKYDSTLGRMVSSICSTGDEMADFYDSLDSRYFTVCLDIGHCGLIGCKAEDIIRELGAKRIGALHVHDNDGIGDLHTAPYHGKTNWDEVMKALADIGYEGDLTFEVGDRFLECYINEPELLSKAYELLAVTGRNLIKKFESCKK